MKSSQPSHCISSTYHTLQHFFFFFGAGILLSGALRRNGAPIPCKAILARAAGRDGIVRNKKIEEGVFHAKNRLVGTRELCGRKIERRGRFQATR